MIIYLYFSSLHLSRARTIRPPSTWQQLMEGSPARRPSFKMVRDGAVCFMPCPGSDYKWALYIRLWMISIWRVFAVYPFYLYVVFMCGIASRGWNRLWRQEQKHCPSYRCPIRPWAHHHSTHQTRSQPSQVSNNWHPFVWWPPPPLNVIYALLKMNRKGKRHEQPSITSVC